MRFVPADFTSSIPILGGLLEALKPFLLGGAIIVTGVIVAIILVVRRRK